MRCIEGSREAPKTAGRRLNPKHATRNPPTGELIVYGQDLSAGMYSYYLVADGKTIASKKMVVSGR